MTPSKPYLLRAVYEWILDNDCTPYMAVYADFPGTEVPREYVENGQITLNLSPSAVVDLLMDNDFVAFSARFNGVSRYVTVPIEAVLGLFAKENGKGMAFPLEEDLDLLSDQEDEYDIVGDGDDHDDDPDPPRPSGPPSLKVVK